MSSTRRPVQPLSNRPLADRAREALLRAIREDRFPAGRLPPEAQLAAQLGVSRGTLRTALQALSAEGLVHRRRRHGTYVNQHVLRSTVTLNRLVPFATLIEQSGYVAGTDQPRQRSRPLGPDEAIQLDREPGTPVLEIVRLLRADAAPVISITDIVAMDQLSVPPNRLRAADTTIAFLALNTDAPADYATSEIVPMIATADGPAGLEMAPGTAYIQLRETLFDADGSRLALSVVDVVDRLVRLSLLRRAA